MNIFIAKDGKRQGPYSIEQLKGLIGRGEISLSDQVWHEGCTNWARISDMPHLVNGILPPPPEERPRITGQSEPPKQQEDVQLKVTESKPGSSSAKDTLLSKSSILGGLALTAGMFVGTYPVDWLVNTYPALETQFPFLGSLGRARPFMVVGFLFIVCYLGILKVLRLEQAITRELDNPFSIWVAMFHFYAGVLVLAWLAIHYKLHVLWIVVLLWFLLPVAYFAYRKHRSRNVR